MKTISESDWALAEAAVKKVMDTTLSRSEHKKLSDLIARLSADQSYTIGHMGLCAEDLTHFASDASAE